MHKSLRHGYLNYLAGRIVLACLLSALTSCALAATPWQVKDFEIPTSTSQGAAFDIPIKKNSARCFEILVAGPAIAAELVIRGKNLPRSTQQQLRIGTVGGQLVGSPFILPFKDNKEPGERPIPFGVSRAEARN